MAYKRGCIIGIGIFAVSTFNKRGLMEDVRWLMEDVRWLM
jgi:hypothetical protein